MSFIIAKNLEGKKCITMAEYYELIPTESGLYFIGPENVETGFFPVSRITKTEDRRISRAQVVGYRFLAYQYNDEWYRIPWSRKKYWDEQRSLTPRKVTNTKRLFEGIENATEPIQLF